MENFIIGILVFTAIGMGFAYMQTSYAKKKRTGHLDKKGVQEIENITIGNYIAGFENFHSEIEDINLSISKEKFNFFTNIGSSIGEININSITNIMLEDKSTVHQRLTATRILALGIFSLAAPKKKKNKEYCIVFEWEDSNAEIQNAIFEFKGMGCKEFSSDSYQTLKKYLPKKNKKCPFCAETIKRIAVVCKHCGKDVPSND